MTLQTAEFKTYLYKREIFDRTEFSLFLLFDVGQAVDIVSVFGRSGYDICSGCILRISETYDGGCQPMIWSW